MRRIHVAVIVAAAALLSLSCSDRVPTAPSAATQLQQLMKLSPPPAGSCVQLPELLTEADLVFGKKSPNSNSVRGKIDLIAKAVAKGDFKLAKDHAFKTVDFILQQARDKQGVPGTQQVASLNNHILCYARVITDPQNAVVVESAPTTQVVTNTVASAGVQLPPNSLTETTVLEFVKIPADTFAAGKGPLLTKLDQYAGFFVVNASSATDGPLAAPAVVGVCPAPGIDSLVRQRLRLGHQAQPDSAHFVITPAADASFLQCPTQTAAIDRLPGWLRSVATLVLPKNLYARQLAAFSGGVGGTAGEFSPFGPVDYVLEFSGGVGGTAGEFMRMPAQETLKPQAPSSPKKPMPKTLPKLKQLPASRGSLLDNLGACLAIDAPWGTPVDPACRPTITVTTHLLTPLNGVPVSWGIDLGGGKVTSPGAGTCGVYGDSAFTTTDAAGKARVCWTLGNTVGTNNNTVVARPYPGGDAPVGVTFVPSSRIFTASALKRTPVVQISCPNAPYNYTGGDQDPCTAAVTDPVNSANLGTVAVTYDPTPPHAAGTYTANASYAGSALYFSTNAAQQTFQILTAQAVFTWTGATSTDWKTASNWSPASVPQETDDVVIPNISPSSNYPVIPGGQPGPGVRNITIAASARLTIGSNTSLRVRGDYVADPTSVVTSGGSYIGFQGSISGAPYQTIRGAIAVAIAFQDVQLAGRTTAASFHASGGADVGATVDLNGNTLVVSSDFQAYSHGKLKMTNALDTLIADRVFVAENAGNGTDLLTDGIIWTRELRQSGASGTLFAPTGNHLTVLHGNAVAQLEDPGSLFRHLRLAAGTTVSLETDVKVSGDLIQDGVGSGSIMFAGSGGTRTLTVGGLRLSNTGLAKTFNNVRLKFVDGTANGTFSGVTFSLFPADFTGSVLEVQRPGGTYTFQNIDFSSVPSTATYLRAEDTAPTDGDVLNVNFDGVTPAYHGGHVSLVGEALTNWPETLLQLRFEPKTAELVAGWSNLLQITRTGSTANALEMSLTSLDGMNIGEPLTSNTTYAGQTGTYTFASGSVLKQFAMWGENGPETDRLIVTAPNYAPDTAIITLVKGRILVNGWPTTLAVGQSAPLTVTAGDQFGNPNGNLVRALDFALAPTSGLVFTDGNNQTITSIQVPQRTSATFYVKAVAPGTQRATISFDRDYMPYTNSLNVANSDPNLMSGFGTPTIDGDMTEGEWNSADCKSLTVNTPGGATTDGQLCVMNDANHLYYALKINRDNVAGERNSATFEFDNDGSGDLSAGDDGMVINPGLSPMSFDLVRYACVVNGQTTLCGGYDTERDGTNDVSGTFAQHANYRIYEFSKALHSGDANDFALGDGDRIGFFMSIRILDDSSYADTDWPGSYGQMTTVKVKIAAP